MVHLKQSLFGDAASDSPLFLYIQMKIYFGILLQAALALPTSSTTGMKRRGTSSSGSLNTGSGEITAGQYFISNQMEDLSSSEESSHQSPRGDSIPWIPRQEDVANRNHASTLDGSDTFSNEDEDEPDSKSPDQTFFTANEIAMGSDTSSINSDRHKNIPRVNSLADSLTSWMRFSKPQDQLPNPPQQPAITATRTGTHSLAIPTEVATPNASPASPPRRQIMNDRDMISRIPNAPRFDAQDNIRRKCFGCSACPETSECCCENFRACFCCPCEIRNMYRETMDATRETVNAFKEAFTF